MTSSPCRRSWRVSFPQFSAGDLLVSLRSINLVFVLDPESLKVKWWRIGPWRRQHDPDWQDGGVITVFDNNMHRRPSRIVSISPQSYETESIADGTEFDFYTGIRGKHQVLPNGGVLITIPQQGHVVELDRDGNVVFEFLNVFAKDEKRESASLGSSPPARGLL